MTRSERLAASKEGLLKILKSEPRLEWTFAGLCDKGGFRAHIGLNVLGELVSDGSAELGQPIDCYLTWRAR